MAADLPVGGPADAAASSAPEKHRVHHSYIWLGGLRTAFVILLSIAISTGSSIIPLLATGSGGLDFLTTLIVFGIVGFAVLLVIVLVAVYQVVSYKHLWYELGDEEFSLYSGIFSKKRVHVPYRRIQSVDQRASLLQRIFGVCSVSIDTAGGSNNKAVRVPYIQKAQAEQLRSELFMRKAHGSAAGHYPTPQASSLAYPGEPGAHAAAAIGEGGNLLDMPAGLWDGARGVFAGEEVDTGRITYEYRLNNKELVFTGLSNNTAFALIVIGVLSAVATVVSEMIPLLFGEYAPMADIALSLGMRLFGGSIVAFVVVAVVGLMLVTWLVSTAATCISYGGFRCRRRGDRIEVERGLLQHQFQGVNVERVQSVTVKQTFIRRLLGYCEVSLGKIDAVQEGSDGKQQVSLQQGLVVHPFVKMSRVPEILAGIIPEFAGVPTEVRPVPPVALRRAIIRRAVLQGGGFWLAVLTAIPHVLLNAVFSAVPPTSTEVLAMLQGVNIVAIMLYVLAVVLFALDIVGAVLWHKDSGFAFNRGFMQVSNGGFSRESVSFPRRKIQFGYTRTNPFQRAAHTASIHARTAAGVGGTTVRLIDAGEEDAAVWLEWLKPQGNVVE